VPLNVTHNWGAIDAPHRFKRNGVASRGARLKKWYGAVWNAIIRLKERPMRHLPVFLLATAGLLLAQPKTIVFSRLGPSRIQLFVSNADGTAERPLLNSDSLDYNPVWSPDGNRIAFSSDRLGHYDLYQHASDGSGQDELLLKSDHAKQATDWSRDGRFLLYYEIDPKTLSDLWVLPMDEASGERRPSLFLRTDFEERDGKFSPDGHWIAYDSTESGRSEVYVRPFPQAQGGGAKWMVSRSGGAQPRWRGDGKELFFLAQDGTVMAAAVSANGAAFQPGTPTALFKAPPNQGWDVFSDGNRFLFPVPSTEVTQAPFTVVLNWMPQLNK